MMPKTIPSIEKDAGMQADAINSFATGFRCGYGEAEKDWQDAVNLYKRCLDNMSEEAFDNALRRGR